jgi:hypothetical protein
MCENGSRYTAVINPLRNARVYIFNIVYLYVVNAYVEIKVKRYRDILTSDCRWAVGPSVLEQQVGRQTDRQTDRHSRDLFKITVQYSSRMTDEYPLTGEPRSISQDQNKMKSSVSLNELTETKNMDSSSRRSHTYAI